MTQHKHHHASPFLVITLLMTIAFSIGYMTNMAMVVTFASQKQGAIGLTTPGAPTATLIPTTRPTVAPTVPPANSAPVPTSGPVAVSTPAIGGPKPPSGYYCIDDVDPDMCDDNSSHLVPKGAGGATGSCGTIMEQVHKLVMALPQDMKIDGGNGVRDYLTTAVSNSCHSTGPHPKGTYVSTRLVIDAFRLAGFSELDPNNASMVSPNGLFSWWQSPPSGYSYIPYTPTVIQEFGTGKRDLTGCVAFLKTSSSYHIGIVNKLELFTVGGDGVFSILQAGSKMYIDRFPMTGWSIRNTSTNQTTTNGLTGFGCHT